MHVMQRSAFRKWLSTKNRSPQRSTPRHPIAMASTAKPPDPMPCELAAVLLPESRAHGFHMQKTLFPGPVPHVRGGIRARPVPACRVRSCSVGGRRASERHPGYREAVPGTAGGRRPLVESCSRRGAPGGCAGQTGLRGFSSYRSWTCVDAWAGAASGGSFRAVAPVAVWGLGLLLRESMVDYGNAPDNAYSQGVRELNASAGAC